DHADVGREFVLAALQSVTLAVKQRHDREHRRILDDAGLRQLIGDRAAVVLAAEHEDRILRQRAGPALGDQHGDEASDANNEGDEQERQKGAELREAEAARRLLLRLARRRTTPLSRAPKQARPTDFRFVRWSSVRVHSSAGSPAQTLTPRKHSIETAKGEIMSPRAGP